MTKILVHYEGLDGGIELNAKTGLVETPVDQRPQWADGLVCGLLAERQAFYFGNDKIAARLDRDKHPKIANTKLIAFQDLGWVGTTPEGYQCEVEADELFRQSMINQALGFDEEGTELHTMQGEDVEQAIAKDVNRSDAEVETLKNMSEAGFGGGQANEERKSGTA